MGDFRALQPPFTMRIAGSSTFKGLAIICGFIAFLGVVSISAGLGFFTATCFFASAVLFCGLGYLNQKRSVRIAKQKYETNIYLAYKQSHCPDQRSFEADDDGFQFSCKCGIVRRPWTELIRFAENDLWFFLGTKTGSQAIPKAAFNSTAAVTEFRAFATAKMGRDDRLLVPVEFTYNYGDIQHGVRLHVLRGGGWRTRIKVWISTICIISFVGAMSYFQSPCPDKSSLGIIWGAFGAAAIVLAIRSVFRRRRFHSLPVKLYFDGEGLLAQEDTALSRIRWSQFVGYLENKHVFLFYVNPVFYQTIPKRVISNRESEIRSMISAKLPVYDYRRAFSIATT
jgi:hypothetical protein